MSADSMPEQETAAPQNLAPLRSRGALRMALKGLVFVLVFAAGGASVLMGEYLFRDRGGEEVRVLTFQDWRVICPPLDEADSNCTLSQDVVRDQGGVLVSIVLSNPDLGSTLAITVPHGVLLDPGLGFSVGDQALQVRPYETCTVLGCLAHVTFDDALLELLSDNMNGQVVVVPGDGSPVTIPFSLNGFAAGYTALVQERSRRTSVWGLFAR